MEAAGLYTEMCHLFDIPGQKYKSVSSSRKVVLRWDKFHSAGYEGIGLKTDYPAKYTLYCPV